MPWHRYSLKREEYEQLIANHDEIQATAERIDLPGTNIDQKFQIGTVGTPRLSVSTFATYRMIKAVRANAMWNASSKKDGMVSV